MSSTITALTSGGGLAMAGDTSGQLQLLTNNGTAAVTVDTSQNVGIGTASPASKLDVKAGSGSVISRSTSGVNFKAFYDDGRTEYTSVNYDGISTSGAQDLYVASGSNTYFRTNTNGSLYTPLILDIYGQTLVSKTGTDTTGAGSYFENAQSLGYARLNMVKNASSGTGSTPALAFYYSGTGGVGTIQCSNTATAYNTSSDYRLKQDIAPMTGALATVSALKPVTYKWKADDSVGQGFIAHELAEIVPECVTGEKDAVDAEGNPEYQGIDTSFLVATLTAAIQELNAKVTSLEEQVLNLGVK
jgi:hypothetical protein